MLSLVSKHLNDPSVLRKAEFAARFYPRSMPRFWDQVATFSLRNREHRNSLSPDQARHLVENIEVIDEEALASDVNLTKEIVEMARPGTDTPLGIVLISNKESCRKCGSKLYLRQDRPSTITVYDDTMGTLPGTHYSRYCRKAGCSLQQHYGFFTTGNSTDMQFDDDWLTLPYFMSTRETVFKLEFLCRLDIEVLIGQVSFKQRADIYNAIHGYVEKERGRLAACSYVCKLASFVK